MIYKTVHYLTYYNLSFPETQAVFSNAVRELVSC